MKSIEGNKVNWESTGDISYKEKIRKAELKIVALTLEEDRALSELQLDIDRGYKNATEVSTSTDDTALLEYVPEDVKKSSILNLDELIPKLVS